jgi:chorismate-pyruvate lyase
MTTNRAEWTHPDLHSLLGLFFADDAALGQFAELPAEALPAPYGRLLAHTSHMTVTLETLHGGPVIVDVLEKHKTETHYARKILLRRQSDQQVVQFGIVRLARFALPSNVMQQIQGESVPLGRILIEHNVMRKVKLMSLWRIRPSAELQAYFEPPPAECFGRTALIYANGLPAVELLEILPGGMQD